ncbi:MAG TPA: cell division protein ZipA C-terminal FtsZ-binding domain-containing protein [Gammaproteobacteria bacterium]
MWELRWVLLAMGVVLIGGLYLWHRKPIEFSFRPKPKESTRAEPSISQLDSSAASSDPDTDSSTVGPAAGSIPSDAEKIVALRFMSRGHGELEPEAVVNALKNAGLVHGRYGIFHALPERDSATPRFSVANLTEPGTFDLGDLERLSISGMSFFMVMPGPEDPVMCFDAMIQTARTLSVELNGELFDERGSSWSIQRERYIREEIIEYRHQRSRT